MKRAFQSLCLVAIACFGLAASCVDDIEDLVNDNTDKTYDITVLADPAEGGTVSGGGTYNDGDEIRLTATANNGYTFDGWSNGSHDNPLYITVTKNATYTAYFTRNGSGGEQTSYTIQTNANPSNGGSVTGGGTYNAGSTATLTAVANNGYHFVNWQDGNTQNPRTITVNSNATYTANFAQNGGGGGETTTSYSLVFDGQTLDVAGYSGGATDGNGVWLFECANSSNGQNVNLPYFAAYFNGNTTTSLDLHPNAGPELYLNTVYTDQENNQYGDWQYYSTNSFSCSALDMTAYTMSVTMSLTMYSLADIANQVADDPANCEHKSLSFTGNNLTFQLQSSKSLKKKTVRK